MKTRRDFLQAMTAAAAMAGSVGAPKFSFAQEAGGKTFIKVFQRGGADGLHLFPLYGDSYYYDYRPNLGIEPPNNGVNSALDIGSAIRGMNPNLAYLQEIWDSGNMMLAPSTSFAEANRSHFDCQRWIGTGAQNNLIDGYMNRYMQNVASTGHTLRGVSAGSTSVPAELLGELPVPAVNNGDDFSLQNNQLCSGTDCEDNQLTDLMREVGSHDVDLSTAEGKIRETQIVMLDTIDEVSNASEEYVADTSRDDDGVTYSDNPLGRGLKLCAQLLKAGVPLEVASLDWNIGWDTHSSQISGDTTNPFTDQTKGYHSQMVSGAQDLLAFYRDMGTDMDNIVVLVGSEFGRTNRENGSLGTDHGDGGAWFAFGGPTISTIASDVTTLDDTVLTNDWLPNLTSYRNIVSEIMVRHMGMSEQLISTIFPSHSFEDYSLFSATS